MDTSELQKLKNKYDIIGNDDALNRALETAMAVAPTDLAVLITGESGVGKEIFPQIIHQHSRRKTGKYLAVNCGAIPEGTINAELFGHEKGAFTGAVGEHKGYFEEADGGTLFLDEIGELPKDTQAMLLRVLQNGEFIKVGSAKVEKTNVRIIAATNQNLSYAVATGRFRDDLYYRLAGVQMRMPALRDRNKDDIYLLFRKFSSDFAEKFGLCKLSLTHDAINVLTSYRWPGNIRQLKNLAEAVTGLKSKPASAIAERVEIDSATIKEFIPDEKDELLPAATGGQQSGMSDSDKQMIFKYIFDLKNEVDRLKAMVENGQRAAIPAAHEPLMDYPAEEPEEQEYQEPRPMEQQSIKEANDEMIERVLAKYGGKVKPAADELGISERTLYRKIAKNKGR